MADAAKAMSFVLICVIIILSLSCSALSSTNTILSSAAQILSDSDHLSMSLTLNLAAKTLHFRSSTATIFAPSDFAFLCSGQPSLILLRRHISPVRLSLQTLKNLPCGTRIPTLLSNQPLVVTASSTSDGFISINNVTIDEKAMIDGSSVVIYGIDEFFNSSFNTPPKQPDQDEDQESFALVTKFLRSRGYSIIAAFLDAQLVDFDKKNQMKLTIFAPEDQAFQEFVRNISHYSTIFRQHVVPSVMSWKDLVECQFGTKLPTFSRGFEIGVTVIDGVPLLNDSPVVAQDMYRSDWLVVHGIHGLINGLTNQEESTAGPFS